jgi:uncharacterized SAM-binding protein YcdF (DUF218 family)
MRIKGYAWWGAALLVLFVFVVFAASHSNTVFWKLGRILVAADTLERCDAIYLLGGNYEVRAPTAARLFREGWAPVIVTAREPEALDIRGHARENFTDITIDILERAGVPANRIVQIKVPGGVRSTADEVRALRNYADVHPLHKVLVVTSAFHTHRARTALRRSLRNKGVELRMYPVEEPKFQTSNWWLTVFGRKQVGIEYAKFFYYLATFWG